MAHTDRRAAIAWAEEYVNADELYPGFHIRRCKQEPGKGSHTDIGLPVTYLLTLLLAAVYI